MNLQFWIQSGEPIRRLPPIWQALGTAGIEAAPHYRHPSYGEVAVGDQPVLVSLYRANTTQHLVLNFYIRRPTPATVGVFHRATFEVLKSTSTGEVAEIVLTEALDAFPLVCHPSQGPLPSIHLDSNEEFGPGDPNYWQREGRALHFVSDSEWCHNALQAPELAVRIGAVLVRTRHGYLFIGDWPLKLPIDALVEL